MTPFRTIEISDDVLAPPGLPGLRFITVRSPALGQRADITLYAPPQVQGLRDVPIVLLLHGVYGSHWAWAFKGSAHITAQRLIDQGVLPPLVLAMPSDGLWGDGSGYVRHAQQDFERWITDDVPAAACAACAACSDTSPLCIAGLSMGGFGALRLAGKHPQKFVAAAGHSSVTEAAQIDPLLAESRAGWSAEPADLRVLDALCGALPGARPHTQGPLPALRFDCGRDDPFIEANRRLHADLQAAGIAHIYAEHDGGHSWDYWSQHLDDTLRFFGAALASRSTCR